VEEPAEKPPRVLLDDRCLPRFQLDPTVVLAAGAVLGEEARPVLPPDRGDSAPGLEALVNPRPRLHRAHGVRHLAAVHRVATIIEHRQQVDASTMSSDGPVTEIPAQEMSVGRQIGRWATLTSGTHREEVLTTTGKPLTLVEPAPSTHRLDRDPADLRGLCVENALV
jgi:hypothetical protein